MIDINTSQEASTDSVRSLCWTLTSFAVVFIHTRPVKSTSLKRFSEESKLFKQILWSFSRIQRKWQWGGRSPLAEHIQTLSWRWALKSISQCIGFSFFQIARSYLKWGALDLFGVCVYVRVCMHQVVVNRYEWTGEESTVITITVITVADISEKTLWDVETKKCFISDVGWTNIDKRLWCYK